MTDASPNVADPPNGAPSTGATPTEAATRIGALDALRGIAVLGIFAVNIIGFALPGPGFAFPRITGGDGLLNYGLWTFVEFYMEGSMRGLFSLLFGASVILFTERRPPDGATAGIATLYYRRTSSLILFGLIHAYVLLMPGDILLIYGIAGLFMFPIRNASPRSLMIAAAAIAAAFMAFSAIEEIPEISETREITELESRLAGGATLNEDEQARIDAWREDREWRSPAAQQREIAERTGDIATLYMSNAAFVGDNSSISGLIWWAIDAAMMMMLGMALFRTGVLTGDRSREFYVRLMIAGYAVGLSLRAFGLWERWDADFSPLVATPWILQQPARIALTLGHVGLFFLLWRAFHAKLPFRALGAAGRMAFSNYIGQTVIANLIFTSVGLGLFGSLVRWQIYLLMASIWIAQLAFSMLWLARFRFGPLEWAWRSLIYWRRPTLRRAPA
ncbi:MAG: DUF418 domain-containing protein [Alphaproteobacteria bacterium]|nr:DUF418 domain-containing protein [Alphaproteobacteria bacterium]